MHKFLDLGLTQNPKGKSPYMLANHLYTADMIRDYWQNLFQKLDLTKGDYNNISLATPFCYDCFTRSTIIDILLHQYGIAQCNIIPRSLSLVMGYLALNPQFEIPGDLLLVSGNNKQLDYSFISMNESFATLEFQGWGSIKDLQDTAKRLGLYSNHGWGFNHILYENNLRNDGQFLSEFQSCPGLQPLSPQDISDMVLKGLRYSGPDFGPLRPRNLRIVYPYDFYLQKFDPLINRPVLTKIPFDTANLELDLNGSYKIARLANHDLHPEPDFHNVSLAIYEKYRYAPRPENFNWPAAMVFQALPGNLPLISELWLNMLTARITLRSPADTAIFNSFETVEFLNGWQNSPQYLYRLLKNSPNQELKENIQHFISSPSDPDNLDKCLDAIQLKLYTLLQLWSNG
ncbi:Uncharacterized [Syntrophomonas zehnderi OL-4]|uniref:Uncharacterized n=1 Tax=Syntrophomonas zehnderi OL-4 TaxID=690567 RepID=A0A0E4C9K1_9FIRM|nr:hypothetical protein [Syntrophomonas zehnderi]CFY01400.1 Uncharacterized [Syntrophomonas zehnderi OL-4]